MTHNKLLSSSSDSVITIHDEDSASNNNNDDDDDKDSRRISRQDSSFIGPASTPAQLGMWKIVHRQRKRRAAYIELGLHIIFTVIFLVIIMEQRSIYGSYLMNEGINTALITQQMDFSVSPFSKTFTDIGSWNDVAQYLTDIIGGALDNNQNYNGAPLAGNQMYFIQYNNRLLGGIRLRQLRVRNNSCDVPPKMSSVDSLCYSNDYNDNTKDTRPYGANNKYNYTSSAASGSVELWGYAGSWYDGGGYIVDIPQGSQFTNKLQELVNDSWYDRGTRAIIVSLNMVNVALDARVAVLYLMLEFTAGGAVVPSVILTIFRLDLYLTSVDYFRAFLEVVFVLFVGYWVYQECKEFRSSYSKTGKFYHYFTSLWNMMEVVNLLAFIVTICMYIAYLADPDRKVNLDDVHYIPQIEQLASRAINYYNISAFNIMICAFRTFKYFRLNEKMFILWKALRVASGGIASFLLMFFVLLFGFILMGMLTFGVTNQSWSTFAYAWGSIWNFVLGNPPDYGTLYSTNRVLGPLFFMVFTVFIFFIMINMFIAILNDALSEVKMLQQKRIASEQDGGVTEIISSGIKRAFNSIRFRKRSKTKRSTRELIEKMRDPNVLNRGHITLEEMKTAIGDDATDTEAKELMIIHKRLLDGDYDQSLLDDIPMEQRSQLKSLSLAKVDTNGIAASSSSNNNNNNNINNNNSNINNNSNKTVGNQQNKSGPPAAGGGGGGGKYSPQKQLNTQNDLAIMREMRELNRKLDGLYDAIARLKKS